MNMTNQIICIVFASLLTNSVAFSNQCSDLFTQSDRLIFRNTHTGKQTDLTGVIRGSKVHRFSLTTDAAVAGRLANVYLNPQGQLVALAFVGPTQIHEKIGMALFNHSDPLSKLTNSQPAIIPLGAFTVIPKNLPHQAISIRDGSINQKMTSLKDNEITLKFGSGYVLTGILTGQTLSQKGGLVALSFSKVTIKTDESSSPTYTADNFHLPVGSLFEVLGMPAK